MFSDEWDIKKPDYKDVQEWNSLKGIVNPQKKKLHTITIIIIYSPSSHPQYKLLSSVRWIVKVVLKCNAYILYNGVG